MIKFRVEHDLLIASTPGYSEREENTCQIKRHVAIHLDKYLKEAEENKRQLDALKSVLRDILGIE